MGCCRPTTCTHQVAAGLGTRCAWTVRCRASSGAKRGLNSDQGRLGDRGRPVFFGVRPRTGASSSIWTERLTTDQKVGGSSPSWRTRLLAHPLLLAHREPAGESFASLAFSPATSGIAARSCPHPARHGRRSARRRGAAQLDEVRVGGSGDSRVGHGPPRIRSFARAPISGSRRYASASRYASATRGKLSGAS
jgi:hypothetical protein